MQGCNCTQVRINTPQGFGMMIRWSVRSDNQIVCHHRVSFSVVNGPNNSDDVIITWNECGKKGHLQRMVADISECLFPEITQEDIAGLIQE